RRTAADRVSRRRSTAPRTRSRSTSPSGSAVSRRRHLMGISIRDEEPSDAARIRELIRDAFKLAEHSTGAEWKIVDGLREAGALTVSLVAHDGDHLVG